jgi:flavin reductase (DIM6/NTAB) family NADH-FMN oxidoreductase RutF
MFMSTSSNAAEAFEANDLAEIRFPESGADVSFRFLQDVVVPRPVFLVSTVSEAAVNNVAPFSYIAPASTTPTALVLSILRRDDGSEKDTLLNLRASGELVINAVTESIVQPANACAENLPPHMSEFEFAGLTPAFLTCRTPHVAQSPVRLECRVESETPLGGDGRGAASIVIVSVTRAYVAKAMYRGKGQLEVAALRLIGRSSVDQYLVADGQFTIARPNTGEAVV